MFRGAARRWRARPTVRVVAALVTAPLVLSAAACGSRTASEAPSAVTSTTGPTATAPATRAQPVSDDVMLLKPVEVPSVSGDQIGSGDLTVGVSTVADGRVRVTSDGPRGTEAFRFPDYVAGGRYPLAVLTVTNSADGTEDELDPGEDDFSWGASFRLDQASEGRADDNGNNLVQRGLFSQPTFYKAELDDDKAGCSIRGTAGVVILHSPYVVPVGVWHRLQCDRYGRYVRLRVWNLETGLLVSTAAKSGPIGTLATPSGHRQVPLSVGGKVKPGGGVLRTASDQFNGSIASPFLRIDD